MLDFCSPTLGNERMSGVKTEPLDIEAVGVKESTRTEPVKGAILVSILEVYGLATVISLEVLRSKVPSASTVGNSGTLSKSRI